jgi:large conductance mechanosensitive channel
MFEELKKFVFRGNVVELAVAVIVANAFGEIINSLVSDVLMPPLGLLIGNIDFSDFHIVLKESVGNQPEVAIYIGKWLNTVISFFFVAVALFYISKISTRNSNVTEEGPSGPTQEQLLTEIRDLLKK